MEQALKGVPESWQETPGNLVPIVANDPSGKVNKELIYRELLPPPPADEEPKATEAKQAPAPVQDAKPKPVEKPAAPKVVEKAVVAEKPAAPKAGEKPAAEKPAEKKN